MRLYLSAVLGVAALVGCAATEETRLAETPAPSPSVAPTTESAVGSSDAIPAACPEPAGGWDADASRVNDAALQEAVAAARAHPDHAGLWVSHLGTPSTETPASEGIVLNVAVAGDVEAARSELAVLWNGPLCVVAASRTLAELTAIRDELFDAGAVELGLEPSFGAPDEVRNVVRMGIRGTLSPTQRAALDARYGVGTVVVEERSQVQLVPGVVSTSGG